MAVSFLSIRISKTDNIGDNEADRITISKPTTLNLDAKIISP